MTQEHVNVTEEVQKDGKLVSETRETLHTTQEVQEHPSTQSQDVTPADRRIYTENPDGTSSSRPMTDEELTQQTVSDEEVEEGTGPEVCGHPIGNGECQLEPDHSGQHRLHIED